MSKYRIVDTSVWHELFFGKCSPETIALYYFLHAYCDSAGFYKINLKFMEGAIGTEQDGLKKAIGELKSENLYVRSENKEYIFFKDFLVRQRKLPLNPKNNEHKPIITQLNKFTNDPNLFKGVKEIIELIPVSDEEIKTKKPPVKRTKFDKPTVDEIESYMRDEKKFQQWKEESQRFYDHYESNGWKVGGKTKMKDWRASASNWIKNYNERNSGKLNGNAQKKSKVSAVKESHEESQNSGMNWNEVFENEIQN